MRRLFRGSVRKIKTLLPIPRAMACLKIAKDPQGNWHLAPTVPIFQSNDREGHGQEQNHDLC